MVVNKIERKLISYGDNTIDTNLSDILNVNTSASKDSIPTVLTMINDPLMWKNKLDWQGITVAIIDTGCQIDYSDLSDQIIDGRNFTQKNNSDPNIYQDYNNHGMHVSGI